MRVPHQRRISSLRFRTEPLHSVGHHLIEHAVRSSSSFAPLSCTLSNRVLGQRRRRERERAVRSHFHLWRPRLDVARRPHSHSPSIDGVRPLSSPPRVLTPPSTPPLSSTLSRESPDSVEVARDSEFAAPIMFRTLYSPHCPPGKEKDVDAGGGGPWVGVGNRL